MPHNALAIVEEYLSVTDIQVRKNALTALAVFANDETEIAKLIEVALNDPEIEIRRRAEKEITLLNSEALYIALMQLHTAISEKSTSLKAYALLGRLRSKGIDTGTPKLSLIQRLRLAANLNWSLYPARGVSFRLRALKYGLLGAILAISLIGLFLYVTTRVDLREFINLVVMTVIFGPIAAALITQRTSPIAFQFDRFAAFLVEVGMTMLFSLLCSLLLVVILLLDRWKGSNALEVLIFVPLIVGSTRAGTILAHGIFRRQRRNLWAQISIGAMAGFLVQTLITFLLWQTIGTDGWTPYKFYYEGSFLLFKWAFFLPLSFCMATAFAFIDLQAPPFKPIAGRASLPLCFLIAVLFISLTSLTIVKTRRLMAEQNFTFEIHKYEFEEIFNALATHTVNNKFVPPLSSTSR